MVGVVELVGLVELVEFVELVGGVGIVELVELVGVVGVVELVELVVIVGIVELVELVGVVGSEEKHLSKSEAKRLLKQGAVEVDGKVIKDAEAKVPIYGIVKVGKRRFVRIDTYKNTK